MLVFPPACQIQLLRQSTEGPLMHRYFPSIFVNNFFFSLKRNPCLLKFF